jgi:hypothetical protein
MARFGLQTPLSPQRSAPCPLGRTPDGPQSHYGRGDEQKISIPRRGHYYQHKILYRILVGVLWVLEMAVKTNDKHKNVCVPNFSELLAYVDIHLLSAGNGRGTIYNAQAAVMRSVPSERSACLASQISSWVGGIPTWLSDQVATLPNPKHRAANLKIFISLYSAMLQCGLYDVMTAILLIKQRFLYFCDYQCRWNWWYVW